MNRPALRIVIIALTLVTAAIHLYLNFNTGRFEFQPMFTLNALGYLALLASFFQWVPVPFLAGRGRLLWQIFMGYTALTIVAYFAVNGAKSLSNPIGLADKAVEALLIASLWIHKDN